MVNPCLAIKLATSGFGFYGILGFAAPQLCYKLLFRGGIWPGTKQSETLPEEGDIAQQQAIKWMGFCGEWSTRPDGGSPRPPPPLRF